MPATKWDARELRFGVIGCGKMSSVVHCPNLNTIPGARTVAYCDLDESRAAKLLATHGGEYTTADYKKIMADGSIDAVLIQVGPMAHPMLVQAAARAKKHIFVEKPLALEMSDAMACVHVVQDNDVKFIVGTCNRLAPFIVQAKKLCPRPKYTRMHSASTVTHAACHMIDLAVNLFHEAPLERVYAQGGVFFGGEPDRPIDSFSATLTFADGTINNYLQHWIANGHLGKYAIELYDTDRVVHVGNRYMELHYMRTDGLKQTWKYEGDPIYRGPNGYMGHHDELVELCDRIRDGGTPAMNVRDAARQVAVELAIVQSVRDGKAVDFPAFLRRHDAMLLEESSQRRP